MPLNSEIHRIISRQRSSMGVNQRTIDAVIRYTELFHRIPIYNVHCTWTNTLVNKVHVNTIYNINQAA